MDRTLWAFWFINAYDDMRDFGTCAIAISGVKKPDVVNTKKATIAFVGKKKKSRPFSESKASSPHLILLKFGIYVEARIPASVSDPKHSQPNRQRSLDLVY